MGLLLKCEHVGFGYENQDAVLDVNLEVNEGDYICIVGENGSGKSTGVEIYHRKRRDGAWHGRQLL